METNIQPDTNEVTKSQCLLCTKRGWDQALPQFSPRRSLATECMLQMTVVRPPPRIYLIKEHYDPAEEMSIKKPSHSGTSSGQPTLLPHLMMRQAACLWNWHLLMGSPGHYCWLESLPASYHPTFRVQSTELGDEAP
jgi:hypothetical protein